MALLSQSSRAGYLREQQQDRIALLRGSSEPKPGGRWNAERLLRRNRREIENDDTEAA